jgi:putative ABC transport system permease protein
METLLKDLQYAFRVLAKRPGFTAVAVVALALGIGANTAIFSVVNSVLLNPLPFEESERLMVVRQTNLARGMPDMGVSLPDFRAWRESNQVFEHMTALATSSFNISEATEPERVMGATVTSEFFSVLKSPPAVGRAFTAQEEVYGHHYVAVLSHALWQRRFGAAAKLDGQTVMLNGERYAVIGVMPRDFQFPDPQVELWTPLSLPDDSSYNTRGNFWLNVVARLKPNNTEEQARADIAAIAHRLEQDHPELGGIGTAVLSLREEVVGSVETPLIILLVAVGFVLLIACANVANLMLARATARQKEFAVRTALGATRRRLIRQLLTESLTVGLAGGAAGLLLAFWGVDALTGFGPEDLPRISEIGVDRNALLFTLAVSVLTGIIFGLVPAIHASRPDLNDALKEGGRATGASAHSRVRSLLVVAEIALALVLLIGAGLMINSLLRLQNVNPGFNPQNVLTMLVALPDSKYSADRPDLTTAFFGQLSERVGALSGVESVGLTTSLPFTNTSWGKLFSITGRAAPATLEEIPAVQYRQVSAGYFETMQIPIVKGRLFDRSDDAESAPVAIINETLAKRFWPDANPIGETIILGPPEEMIPPGILPPGYRFTRFKVVGIVGSVKHNGLTADTQAEVFTPNIQAGSELSNTMFLAARTTSNPLAFTNAIRNIVYSLDRDQPVARVATMETLLADSMARSRFITLLLGVFAAVAMILAGVGVYGVMSYTVAQRTHEIGVRMALGASSGDVLRLVARQGLVLALAGVAIGLAASLLLTQYLSSQLYGVSATDPVTFAAISLLLVGVALVACALPARRATRVDPMVALRYE